MSPTDLINTTVEIFGRQREIHLTMWSPLIALVTVIGYALLLRDIPRRRDPPLFVAWSLWLLLDGTIFLADFFRHEHPELNVLFGVYTIGTAIICVSIISYAGFKWNKVWDTLTALCVGVAIYIWLKVGDDQWGVICALAGLTIATIPVYLHIIGGADESPVPWIFFAMGSGFGTLDGYWLEGGWCLGLQIGLLLLIWWKRRPVRVTA